MKKEGQVRIPSGCAIAAVISRDGKRMSGEMITRAMKPMHDRSNGLGGGFAGYGIYPEYKDFYALHMFFDSRTTRKGCEAFFKEYFEIILSERIPTRKIPTITDEPIIWRYFVAPLGSMLTNLQLDEKEFVARAAMKINTEMNGAYVFSSGKNMGTFKAVGFPEDVGEFYKLEEYEGYSWTAHGRYPTNVIAAPFWSTIEGEHDEELRKRYLYLRTVFPSLLITGPFSIVLGFTGGIMALNDRLKLRSMVVGEKDDRVYIASEEASIRTMEPNAENIWAPAGGEPVIVYVKEGAF